jgi:MFS family permease
LGHLSIGQVHGVAVYAVRILLTIGIAGGVGASLTYVSLRVPENRIAEMVGLIGTSGFVGLAIGPVVGDLLFRTPEITRLQIDRMFLLAALAATIALIMAALGTRHQIRKLPQRRQPPVLPLVRRYHPGAILLVAFAMGLGIGLPGVFVRAYTAELGIVGIQMFFLVYAAVAFAVRVATRRLPEQIGIRSVILLGLGGLSVSMLLYLLVHQAWQLAIPAVVAGFAHALLFPAVVAGGSRTFPVRYRGLATTLVLGMFDLGNLVGQPAVGNLLYFAQQLGWPKYPTMFVLVAVFLAVVGLVYAKFARPESHASTLRFIRPARRGARGRATPIRSAVRLDRSSGEREPIVRNED